MFTPFSYIQPPQTSSYFPTLLVVGSFQQYNQYKSTGIIKITPSGNPDLTFNSEGPNANVYSIVFQSDGKILVGGQFTTYSGSSFNRIARINSSGTLDTTFNIGTGADNNIETILPFPDNSCLIGGLFTTYSGSSRTYIARLNPSGSITSSFDQGPQGFSGGKVNTLATQSDGKIIAGGLFTNYGYGVTNRIAAISSSGDLLIPSPFNIGTGFSSDIYTMATQSDNKIILGGAFTTYSGSSSNYIIRLNTDGTRDTTFNIGTGFNSNVSTLIIQSDGKILVGGVFTTYSGSANNYIVRLNSDGTKDTSYVIGTGFNGQIKSIRLQNDDKAYVGGFFDTYSGSIGRNYITRINTNGTRDTTFNSGTGFGSLVYGLAVQSDNKVIVTGQYTTYSGSTQNRITRINTDGTLDTTFNIGTGLNALASTPAIDNQGKIYVNGQFSTYSGSSNNGIVRINSDGTKDTTFAIGTGFNTWINVSPTFLQPSIEGGVYVGADFVTYSGSTVNYIVKIQPSGAIDPTFGPSQITSQGDAGFAANVYSGIVSGSTIYLGGSFTGYKSKNRIIRLNPDGTVDPTFKLFSGFNSDVNMLAIQQDDKIIVGGNFSTYSGSTNNYIVRLNSDGTKDTTFNIGTSFNNVVYGLKNDPLTNNTYVIGNFALYSGSSANRLCKILPSGAADTSFQFNVGAGFNTLQTTKGYLDVDSSGRLLVGNSFTAYNNNGQNYFIRINTDGTKDTSSYSISFNYNGTSSGFTSNPGNGVQDNNGNLYLGIGSGYWKPLITNYILPLTLSGSLDTSFNMGAGANSFIYTVTTHSAGKLVIGGLFNTYNNITRNNIAYLNANGTIDTTFNVGAGFNNAVFATVSQSDGKIIAAGSFTTYSGSSINRIVRINTDGTIDNSFNVGTGLNTGTVRDLAIQPDGKIIAGGSFSIYSGSTSNNLVRINTDGTKDTSLNDGTGFNSTIYSIDLQSDNKIVAGGNFTTYSGSISNYLVRINTDGTKDTTLTGTGTNSTIYGLKLEPNSNKIIIMGAFIIYNGSSINRIARINSNGTLDNTFNVGTGLNSSGDTGNTILIDSTNYVYIGNISTTYSGSIFNRIARLTPSGAIDTSFNTGNNTTYKGLNSSPYKFLLK